MRRPALILGTVCLITSALPVLSSAAQAAPVAALQPLAGAVQPYDFDGDGFTDVAVGAPGEDSARNGRAIKNAGVVDVVYGSAAGLNAKRTQHWSLDSPGVPGKAAQGDYFGDAMTSGDYDADGYADLAVAATGKDTAGRDHGSLTLLYGSATGLRATGAITTTMNSGTKAAAGVGASLTTGDFNGDGADDLAVGAPGIQKVSVTLGRHGQPLGLGVAKWWGENALYATRMRDGFGFYLAAGDTNGDGFDELAIGDPFDFQEHGWSIGAVTVVHGGSTGLRKSSAVRWTEDSPGLQGASHAFTGKGADQLCDCFGFQVALGDVTGDGFADLLVSAPGAPVKRAGVKHDDAGTFHLIPGSAQGLTTAGNRLLSQDSPGIPGAATTGRRIGNTIVLGDLDGDGVDEMALAAGRQETVLLFPGGAGFGTRAAAWSLNTTGVPGVTAAHDDFGSYIRFSAIKGAKQQQLLIGAYGKRSGAGAVWIFDSVGATLRAHADVLSQDSPGIKGKAEKGDGFGYL